MSALRYAAAVAVVMVPFAVHGAEPATKTSSAQNKRVCEVTAEIGSRIRSVRRCRSAAEREQSKQESKQVVERIQTLKVSFGS